jgi:hypothetical protein
MRVGNSGVNGTPADLYTRGIGTNGAPKRANSPGAHGLSDRGDLSSASGLVALAKTLLPTDRVSHAAAVRAAVSAGAYETDPNAIGQAVVSEHIGSKE